jgi:hypothetical protein
MIDVGDFEGDSWKSQRACVAISNELVKYVLSLLVVEMNGQNTKVEICTGFPIRYHGIYIWITAGHVIEGLRALAKKWHHGRHVAYWADDYGGGIDRQIPVNIPDLVRSSIAEKHFKCDIGALSIRSNHIALLKAAPERSFVIEPMWKPYIGEGSLVGHYLIGVPNDLTQAVNPKQGNGTMQAELIALPLMQITKRGDSEYDEFWSGEKTFFAQVEPYSDWGAIPVSTVRGMSGGPILAIYRSPNILELRLIGIQRGEKKEHGRLFISGESFGKVLEPFEQPVEL